MEGPEGVSRIKEPKIPIKTAATPKPRDAWVKKRLQRLCHGTPEYKNGCNAYVTERLGTKTAATPMLLDAWVQKRLHSPDADNNNKLSAN